MASGAARPPAAPEPEPARGWRAEPWDCSGAGQRWEPGLWKFSEKPCLRTSSLLYIE